MNLITVFLTGLLTGGLSCLAVQGGLLAATLAQREEGKLRESTKTAGGAMPILYFLLAKLSAYTILGFLLGWFGSVFQLSLSARIVMQMVVALFMLGTAGNMLNLHPIFRFFIIQPPKFLTRLIRNQSKNGNVFAPAILGAFTVFIPCGTTQAMMALAIASGNPILGATIMFAFTIGTSPVFFLLGYFATKLSESLHRTFMQVAGYAIVILAIFNLNNALVLTGSNWTLRGLWDGLYCGIGICSPAQASIANGSTATAADIMTVKEAAIYITQNGYRTEPAVVNVQAGATVKVTIVNQNGGGCTQALTIPRLGLQRIVTMGQSQTIEFVAPSTPGPLAFVCSMGMFGGSINVI